MPQTGIQLAGTGSESGDAPVSFETALVGAPDVNVLHLGTPVQLPIASVTATPENDDSTADSTDATSSDLATSSSPVNGSQDTSGVDATALQPPFSTTQAPQAPVSANAALLADTQAKIPATAQPDGTNVPAIPDADHTTAQPGVRTAAPTNAHKLPTGGDALAQVAAPPSQSITAEALAKGSQPAAPPQNHMMPASSGVKTTGSRQSDKAVTSTTFDRDASLQNSIETAGTSPAPVTNIGGNSAVDANAKQDDGGSAETDRRLKGDAVAGVAASAVPLPTVQTVPVTVHTAGPTAGHQLQDLPVAASSPSFSGNPAVSSNRSNLDSSSTSDVKSVINTSKLLQTMNQSEMRVGMRSSEFGDISIHTSATHDSLLTQISLEHAELAKSLATHIPEMQSRLAGHGNLEVRINANEQSTGTSSAMSDARSGSQGRQQESSSRAYPTSSYGNSSFFDSALPTATLASSLQNVQINGRLDIQA